MLNREGGGLEEGFCMVLLKGALVFHLASFGDKAPSFGGEGIPTLCHRMVHGLEKKEVRYGSSAMLRNVV